jgi:putative two-component system response regulator
MKNKILVVDDAPENIDFLVGILKENYRLVAARNGEKALQLANAATPPDLILLDMMLPDMDGLEICKRLKDDSHTASIPVLFITGKTDNAALEQGFAAGGADFIFKPFHYQLLLSRIATHLELKMLREQNKGSSTQL